MTDFLKRGIVLKIFRIITVVLLISLMIFIFCMSAQNANESSNTSSTVIKFFANIFVKNFEDLPISEQTEIIASFQFIVRKGAHFSVYSLLGVLSYLSLVTYNKIPFIMRSVISSGICLLYSVSDEIHQYFVPGRSCELRDVCIDFCGSLLAITVLTLIAKYSKIKFIRNNI